MKPMGRGKHDKDKSTKKFDPFPCLEMNSFKYRDEAASLDSNIRGLQDCQTGPDSFRHFFYPT